MEIMSDTIKKGGKISAEYQQTEGGWHRLG